MATATKDKNAVLERYGDRSVRKALGDWGRDARHRKALNTVQGNMGGYTVPTALLVNLDLVLQEACVFHRLASTFEMAAKQVEVPTYDLTHSHATGDSPLYGGMGMRWGVGEGNVISEFDPSFNSGSLVAKDLQGLFKASDQLVADGGEGLGLTLEKGFLALVEWAVERACFRGTFADEPQGVVNSPASAVVSRAGAGAVAAADLANMVQALVPACFARAVWCCHPTALSDVAKLASYQVQSGTSDDVVGLCGHIFGRPLYATEKLLAKGTKGDLVLFDPKQYVLGRRCLELAAAPSINTSLIATGQTLFRVLWRGDGMFLAKNTVLLENNSTTCGVSVVLN